ncbi:MAG TPA: hypothetical protein VK734_15095 [Bradyrhizobium sp.]|jgi:hypothetical protein|nr:hypothetical protein [Bradyrhizobium sp.]
MTLLYLRHDDMSATARGNGASMARLFRRIGIAFRLLHRGIVRAKLRRLHSELLFRRDYSEMLPPEEDAAKFPQRPLILGDKWDF